MNNFYGILNIKQISDIIFDYYNKCKLSFYILCVDLDCKHKSQILVYCNEKLIDSIYSKIRKNNMIFVYGKVLNKESTVVMADKIVIIE